MQLENKKNHLDYQFENQDENQDENTNVGCRVFLEQIELISKMPIDEGKEFLWALIMNAYCKYKNQNENQFDYQNENQNECAYVSVSVSVYLSVYKSVINSINKLSEFNKLIFNSMNKTIRFKQFSSNYGGLRKNAGRKKQTSEPQIKENEIPTRDEILKFANSLCKKIDVDNFIAYYSASNWKDKDGMPVNWKQKAITWANRYKEPELSDIEEKSKIIKQLEQQARKEGRIK